MKTAKSYKIIILVTAFVLSIAAAFGLMTNRTASAVSATAKVSNYFSGTLAAESGNGADFTQDGLTATVEDGDTLIFKNDLLLNELSFEMKLPEQLITTITVKADSHYVNGNKKVDGANTTFETSIENKVVITPNSSVYTLVVNGQNATDLASGTTTLQFSVDGGIMKVNGTGNSDAYYKLKNVDGKTIATDIEFKFSVPQGASVSAPQSFTLVSVGQSATDSKYTQSLKTNSDDLLTKAYPRLALNDSFYTRQADGSYKAIKINNNVQYTLTIKSLSVLGGYNSLFVIDNEDIIVESNTTKPDALTFFVDTPKNVNFSIGEKVSDVVVPYEQFTAEVKAKDFEDTVAPVYDADQTAKDGFLYALKKAYTVEKTDDAGNKTTSAPLGTTLKLPSFKDMVRDDFSPYEKLNYTVYYRTAETSTSTANLQFDLGAIGDYVFFVAFKDEAGNDMKEKDFLVEKDGVITNGKYGRDNTVSGYVGNFVYEFTINDDADIEVKAAPVQGIGYKNISYTASKFTVDASGCNMTYKLYYSPKANEAQDSENWIEIPKASSVSTNYNQNGFNYDEIKSINYDGELTFTPTRTGSYKIKCTATSKVSERYAEAQTSPIQVKEATPVKVDTKWLQNNVWSVVFLSVGTLCLAGIIVLLCIKPKDDADKE